MNKKIFQKAFNKAKKLGSDIKKIDYQEFQKKLLSMEKGPVKKIWDKVLFLWQAFNNPDVPAKLKITIIGALLYLVLPIDVLPDYIPGIGFADDISVLLLVFKEVSQFAIPKAIAKARNVLEESCFKQIDLQLELLYESMLKNCILNFIVILFASIIVLYKPFGTPASKIAGISLFTAIFIYSLIRTLIYLKKYGKITFGITAEIFKNKSLKKGISSFIQKKYPLISSIYAKIEIAGQFIPELKNIPDFDSLVEDFIQHYKKNAVLICGFSVLYVVIISVLKLNILK